MDISINNTTSLKGRPSLYHAHFTKLLEMCALDYLHFLRQESCRNPCVEVREGCEVYALRDGRHTLLEEREEPSFDYHESLVPIYGPYREPVDNEQYDPPGACEDFTGSLPLYLSIQMPAFQEKGKSSIFEALVEFIDDRGFLGDDPASIADLIDSRTEEVIEVLEIIGSIDPGGIGSRGIGDFLWYQCRKIGWDTPVMQKAVHELLEYVAEGDIDRLRQELKVSERGVRDMIERLKSLRPYPTWGMDVGTSDIARGDHIIYPDFALYQLDDGDCILQVIEPCITLNPISTLGGEGTENNALNDIYMEDMRSWRSKVECLERESYGLLRMANRRKQIILRVVPLIIERQKAYMLREEDYKEPLDLSQIAHQLGVAVSTVSRAVKDRYITSPRGILSLKDLLARPFPGAGDGEISQDYVSREIESLLGGPGGKTMSDSDITEKLKSGGIDIARRTVNKYRRSLERSGNSVGRP